MSQDEHGSCPNCGMDFNGDLIWEHFYKEFQTTGYWMDKNDKYISDGSRRVLDPDESAIIADKVSENYGATRTSGRWGKLIGIEKDRDRIEEWMCPECKHTWPR